MIPVVLATLSVAWGGVLSSSARLMALRHSSEVLKGHTAERPAYVMIEVADAAARAELERSGVEVLAQSGKIVAARVSASRLQRIATIDGVKRIDGGRRYHLHNDTARRQVGIDLIHQGVNLPQPYAGAGVIYGTFDVGIQFGHKAFTDESGATRMLLAYLPGNDAGEHRRGMIIDENQTIQADGELPGTVFPSERIGELTSDADTETHGTHTVNTAVGRDIGYPYYGMAPEASIVACGGDELQDAYIAAGVALVMATADERGCPAVVNLSLGENTGPHDGTSLMTRFLNSLCGPGRIICVSAGNEGASLIHVAKEIAAEGDSLAVALSGGTPFSVKNFAYVDFWSDDATPFSVQLLVRDAVGTLCLTPPFVPEADGSDIELKAEDYPELFNYLTGGVIRLSGEKADNDRYNVGIEFEQIKAKQSAYTVAVVVKSVAGAVTVNGWTEPSLGVSFRNLNIAGFTAPDTEQTISNLATAPDIISVGAYSSRQKFQSARNGETTYTYYPLDDITSFSSYGYCGRTLPDVAAPGAVVVSAINQTATGYAATGRDTAVFDEQPDGSIIRYSAMWGTSMSSPVVAGAIATWLEADPTLTPADILDVIYATANHDSYTDAAPDRFGAGKFNAYRGLRHILGLSTHVNAVAEPAEDGEAEIYDITGRRVATAASAGLIDSLNLPSGIYIIKYKGVNRSKKLFINH